MKGIAKIYPTSFTVVPNTQIRKKYICKDLEGSGVIAKDSAKNIENEYAQFLENLRFQESQKKQSS